MAGDRLRVAVAGPAGPLTDRVCRALAADASVRVLPWEAGLLDAVALVDPTATCWLAARTTGACLVAVVSHELSTDQAVSSVLWGAEAILAPPDVGPSLVATLRSVVAGATVLSGAQTRALACIAREATWRAQPQLSARERQIAALIAEGYSIKQTARALGIAAKTVENLQGRLYRKLGVRNRAQAAARLSALWATAANPHDGRNGLLPR